MPKSYKCRVVHIFISSEYDYHKCKEVSNLWFCVSAVPTILFTWRSVVSCEAILNFNQHLIPSLNVFSSSSNEGHSTHKAIF